MVEKPKPNLDLCYPFSMFRLGFLFVTTMKDAFYFPHFCNARNDRKVKRVIKQHGIQGYGIYFMLLEVLREQTDYRYPFADVDLLADEFGVEEQTLLSVINDSELFQIDGDSFYSANLIKYLEPMMRMREQRSKAGKASAQRRSNTVTNDNATEFNDRSTTDERVLNENEQRKVKESKLNESKVNESINAHTHDYLALPKADNDPELIQFFNDAGGNAQQASMFFNHYHSQNWVKSNGMAVTNWKAMARKWIDRDNFGGSPYKSKPKSIGEIMSGYNL
jgi:hypothetical protein